MEVLPFSTDCEPVEVYLLIKELLNLCHYRKLSEAFTLLEDFLKFLL